MLSPKKLNPPEAAFAALETGIDVCDRETDGKVCLSIRQIGGSEELELRVFSLLGTFRCQSSDLKSFLERCPENEPRSVSKYQDYFRHGLQDILLNGFGLLKLDFSECKKKRISPTFSLTITKLCKPKQKKS
jgi:hypothetical protein